MGTVQTALGPVSGHALGQTLMHEHIFVLDPDFETNYPGRWKEKERIDDAVRKLEALASHGVQTLVDLTVLGLGRNVARIREAATRVKIKLVVATGLYPFYEL